MPALSPALAAVLAASFGRPSHLVRPQHAREGVIDYYLLLLLSWYLQLLQLPESCKAIGSGAIDKTLSRPNSDSQSPTAGSRKPPSMPRECIVRALPSLKAVKCRMSTSVRFVMPSGYFLS